LLCFINFTDYFKYSKQSVSEMDRILRFMVWIFRDNDPDTPNTIAAKWSTGNASVLIFISGTLDFNHKVNLNKVKALPLQAWSGPEGSSKLRFQDFMTTAQDGGKVVSLTHRPPLPPGNTPGNHFC
jgi:hypothetical protein